ncbi:TPA: hypothetical protein JIQ90_15175 [Acinetobacter baumannii]|nr:hypothetical protein [Acinetobacter baumannii]HAV4363759.1 hypothetical protein [Acinetobacter baumannii]HAV4367622.1 hypothetical protein [Acinetobacter baumannii]HAV4394285.1 hypothetical protein [Acinetobacter baumannii]
MWIQLLEQCISWAPKDINTVLEAQNLVGEAKQKPTLTVMLAQDIPEQMMARAVQINK